MKTMTRWSVALLAMMMTVSACGEAEDGEHAHEEESADAEGCEHMSEGPALPITAAAMSEVELPDATASHKRIDVTLVSGTDFNGESGGYVRYEAAESGEYTIFVDQADVMLEVYEGAMKLPFEQQEVAVTACEEVAVKHVLDLGGGKSYTMKLGPTQAQQVRLVIEAGEHDH